MEKSLIVIKSSEGRVNSYEQFRCFYDIIASENKHHVLPHFPKISILPALNTTSDYVAEKRKLMELFLNKLGSYSFIVEDELFKDFFSSEYKGNPKQRSIMGTTFLAIKGIGEGASGLLKNKLRLPWQNKSDSNANTIGDESFKEFVFHQSNLENFEEIIDKILIQMKQVKDELDKNLNEINFNYVTENIDSLPFKEELLRYRKISIELEKKEKDFAINLSQNIILKLSDMKEDTSAVIEQIKERLRHKKAVEKDQGSSKEDSYKKDRVALENECFISDLKLFCNNFDDNLYTLVNDFLSQSKNLDKINFQGQVLV
jgi:hypothetical protein